MIKIGVSSFFLYPNRLRPYYSSKTLSLIENDMARYLAREDVMPVLLPDLDEKTLFNYIDEMDGIILQGGSDISPETYQEQVDIGTYWQGDAYRDQYELKILAHAYKMGKPILGICRGCQLINVFFGGTLFQDVVSQREDSLVHRNPEIYDLQHHPVSFSPDGHLSKMYPGVETTVVNSVHHQGIKDLGKNLKVEALSPQDRLVEGISYQDPEHFILGVQWHPEFSHTLEDQVIDPTPIADYFFDVCRKKKAPSLTKSKQTARI